MQRKLLTVIAEEALERRVLDCVRAAGAKGYTLTEARGAGSRGVRSADFEKGGNIRIEVICDETTARGIADELHRRYFHNFAMVLFLQDVEVLRPDKF
jgi:hypothetical protein